MKRGHLTAVQAAKKELERVPGMTPARFDLLYAIRQHNILEGSPDAPRALGMRQDKVRKVLGLHRSTVSRMILQLEEWQWLRRSRSREDSRTSDVYLTDLGLRMIWRAMKIAFRQRVFLSFYERLFPTCPFFGHAVQRIARCMGLLDTIAVANGDTSSLVYEYGALDSYD